MPKSESRQKTECRAAAAGSRRRGGRPRAADPRSALTIHLNSSERAKLEADAEAAGSRLGIYIRDRALHARPPRIVPSVNRKDWLDLARLAGNLHQIASAIASGRVRAIGDGLSELILALDDHVRALRLTLLAADREDEE